jgi:hypothetical protein
VIILLINNSSNSYFNFNSLNYYFFNPFVWLNFFFNFII